MGGCQGELLEPSLYDEQIEEKLGQTAEKSSELPRCDRVGATKNRVGESEPKPGMSSDVNLDSPENDIGLVVLGLTAL